MINRNIQMKKRNKDQWENLFPLTLNENVFNNDGIGLTKQLNDIKTSINDIHINVKLFDVKGDGITDDTINIQRALDSFDDIGGVLYFPKGTYLVTEPLIFPTIKNDSKTLIPITILGTNDQTSSSVETTWARGLTIFKFTGTGALFDLRNGNETETNGLNSFKNFVAYGDYKENTQGLKANKIIDGVFTNIKFSGFDVNIEILGSLYYSVFENIGSYRSLTYGLSVGLVNGTTFRDSRFSDGKTGIKFKYSGTAINVDGCWFENNSEYGIHSENSFQLNINNSYFENNEQANIYMRGYEDDNKASLNSVNSFYNIHPDARNSIRTFKDVNVTLINTTVTSRGNTNPFIDGSDGEINVNSYGFITTHIPMVIASESRLNIDYGNINKDTNEHGNSVKTLFKNSVEFSGNNGIRFGSGSGDSESIGRLGDFPELETANGSLRMFRGTNTSGDLFFNIFKGDGSGTQTFRINAKTGEFENLINGGGFILKSPNGTRYTITVTDSGELDIS